MPRFTPITVPGLTRDLDTQCDAPGGKRSRIKSRIARPAREASRNRGLRPRRGVGACARPGGAVRTQPVSQAKRGYFYQITLFLTVCLILHTGVQATAQTARGKTVDISFQDLPDLGETLTATVLLAGSVPDEPAEFAPHAGGYCLTNGQKIVEHVRKQSGKEVETLAIKLGWSEKLNSIANKKQYWIWVFKMPGCKVDRG